MKIFVCVPVLRKKWKRTGEHSFVNGLLSAFNKQGIDTELCLLGEVPQIGEQNACALHVCGAYFTDPIPNMPNLLWIISNPLWLTPVLAHQFQYIFSGSKPFRDILQKSGNSPVEFLPQCTDPDVFKLPDKNKQREVKFFFAGNMRIDFRRVLPEALLNNGADIEVAGRGWDKLNFPSQHIAKWISQTQLIKKYQNAQVVVNDHRRMMSILHFVNNRTYDALACGARLVSDPINIPSELTPYVDILKGNEITPDLIKRIEDRGPFTREVQEEVREIIISKYSFVVAAEHIISKCIKLLKENTLHVAPLSNIRKIDKTSFNNDDASPQVIIADDPALSNKLAEPDNAEKAGLIVWDPTTPFKLNKAGSQKILIHINDVYSAKNFISKSDVVLLLAPKQCIPNNTVNSEWDDARHTITRLSSLNIINTYIDDKQKISFHRLEKKLSSNTEANRLLVVAHEICAAWEKSPICEYDILYQKMWGFIERNEIDQITIKESQNILQKLLLRYDISFSGDLTVYENEPLSLTPSRIYNDFSTNYPFIRRNQINWERKSAQTNDLNITSETSRDKTESFILPPRPAAPKLDHPIGVFLHIFYTENAEWLSKQLDKIEVPLKIYISTNTKEKAEIIRTSFRKYDDKGQLVIKITPNRGRDILPKLFYWIDEHRQHDIVLHLHTKKSPHLKDKRLGWGEEIATHLLSSNEEVNTVLAMFKNIPRLGMLGPPPNASILNNLHWRNNKSIGHYLMEKMLVPTEQRHKPLIFPAGSMFWARTAALEPIFRLQLDEHDFPVEAGQLDGTLAHALERCLAISCELSDFSFVQIASEKYVGPNNTTHKPTDLSPIRKYTRTRWFS